VIQANPTLLFSTLRPQYVFGMVAIRRVIRQMRGGTQSWMVEGEDARFYVLKPFNNPQGRRSSINDWIGSKLLNLLDVHAADCTLLDISPKLVEEHAMAIKTGNSSIRLSNGPHFGSLVPVNPEQSVIFDFLPTMMLPRVSNLDDFFVTQLFDKWVANTDTRQAVFYRPGKRKELRALMIDHGRIFGGDLWQFDDLAHGRSYFDPAVYKSDCQEEKWQNSLARIERISHEQVTEIMQTLPREWVAEDQAKLESLALQLTVRQRRLRRLLPGLMQCASRIPAAPYTVNGVRAAL
jgi:hypothetical protein